MNILYVQKKKFGGVQYYRQHLPHQHLAEHHKDFNVSTIDSLSALKKEWFQEHDIQLVQVSRMCPIDWIHKLKSFGIVTVIDVDDYWKLPKTHNLYENYRATGYTKKAIELLEACDYVTVTTEKLADKVRPHNGNVYVLKNALDPDDPQWKPSPSYKGVNPDQYGRVRFGWFGGTCHHEDLKLLERPMKRLFLEEDDKKFQIILGGFACKDTWTVNDPKGVRVMPVPKAQNTFAKFEKLLTDNYRSIRNHPKLVESLKSYDMFVDAKFIQASKNSYPYRRMWSLPVTEFAKVYHHCDVCLVPLARTEFNRCKSEIKMIEAGLKKKAVIVSNIYPYTNIADDEQNCFVVEHDRWYDDMKVLIDEPEWIEDLSEQLHEDVVKKYNLNTETERRAEMYRSWIDKHNKA